MVIRINILKNLDLNIGEKKTYSFSTNISFFFTPFFKRKYLFFSQLHILLNLKLRQLK